MLLLGRVYQNYVLKDSITSEHIVFNSFGRIITGVYAISDVDNWVEVDYISVLKSGNSSVELLVNGVKGRLMGDFINTVGCIKSKYRDSIAPILMKTNMIRGYNVSQAILVYPKGYLKDTLKLDNVDIKWL